ncbi:MAG: calcium/sodium antiporter [Thiohalomonadales bacterium]
MDYSFFYAIAAIIFGIIFLVWGADRFVDGASGIAANMGISPLLIGLTIVGFGTSAPEILVSIVSAWQDNPGIAVGNAIGSNITNIALVLGITAIITPISIHSNILRREYPVMILIMVIGLLLILDGYLGIVDGLILITGLVALLFWIVKVGTKKYKHEPLQDEFEHHKYKLSKFKAILWLIIGLFLLIVSSKFLVWGSVFIAQKLGMSDLLIGLTIIAIGTSLPELATSVTSALKNEHEIAVGNVIGSNMFNILAVLGIPGLISPHKLDSMVLQRDYPVMLILSLILGLLIGFGFKSRSKSSTQTDSKFKLSKNQCITKIEGAFLLFGYICYIFILYIYSS